MTVLRSDSRGIVLEFRPRYLPVRLVDVQGRGEVVQDFDGAIQEGASASVGGPDLRFRHIPLAFPSETGGGIAVLTAEYEDLPGTSIAPIPYVRMRDDLAVSAAYAENPLLYRSEGFLPRAVAQLAPVSRARGMLLGGVRIFPVQFNSATRTARKYSRIVVEVSYGAQTVRLPIRDKERGPSPAPLN